MVETERGGSQKIIRLETVSSTNDEAKRLGEAGAPGGTVVVAAEQTRGRGRRSREWQSPRGGLWMSMVARPRGKPVFAVPMITIAAGVAVAEALAEAFSDLALDPGRVGLGWPNDVLVEDKKIAGILCEALFPASAPLFVVIGVGVNVNNRASDMPRPVSGSATSLIELSGREYPIDHALEIFVQSLENTVGPLLRGGAGQSEKILSIWKKRSVLLGREVKIQSPGSARYTAVPYGIDSSGRLLVKDVAGKNIAVEFEETTLIR